MFESRFEVLDRKVDFDQGVLTDWQFDCCGLSSLERQHHDGKKQN
jgi:hypothetical protein